ncbi:MAG: hypothetical protein LBT04_07495 [Prevotellaceae bacterium]|jgi:hypothetical protein|nr:hypothetical protein [Prevotellaceae bacterium]
MRRVLFFIFYFGFINILQAQDIILKTNGEEIKATIIEVDETKVKYKKFSNQDGPAYFLLKEEIFMITYPNGDKDFFGRKQAAPSTPITQAVMPPSNGKVYRTGNLYNENGVRGIIYKVSKDGQHGMIFSMQAVDKKMRNWCSDNSYYEETQAYSTTDGMYNMQQIENYIAAGNANWDDFPMFQWARSLGYGWYLPAVDEVRELIENLFLSDLATVSELDYSAREDYAMPLGNCPVAHFNQVNAGFIEKGSYSFCQNSYACGYMGTSTETKAGLVFCFMYVHNFIGQWEDVQQWRLIPVKKGKSAAKSISTRAVRHF